MKKQTSKAFTEFRLNNRIKVNRYLNCVLWFFGVAAPAIALGVRIGIFHDISYMTCAGIFAIVAVLSGIHFYLYKKIPTSIVTSLFALTAVNVLLAYMSLSHVSVYLTWFLVPFLSLLFCDAFIFCYAVGINTVLMVVTTILSAPYRVQLRADYDTARAYLADVLGGFAIETVVMLAAGSIMLKLTTDYLSELFRQDTVIGDQKNTVKEKMEILDSMAEIYDNVNLIDFLGNTETSLRDAKQQKHGLDLSAQTHTLMNQAIKKRVAPDQLEDFLTFTNITTVRDRLRNKKLISADFIDVSSGWFRAQYITVSAAPDGTPDVVIYTTRNVDEEKRREEHLIRIAMTDEMTRLFNRRCYEEDLAAYRAEKIADDLVLVSLDVNGLKPVNDEKGHAAGDELIRGAAACLALSVGSSGKTYRTGGDEFMALVHSDEPEKLRQQILKAAKEWRGTYTDEVTVSVGYAARRDHPDADLAELERLADADMYAEKEKYYRERGIQKRR